MGCWSARKSVRGLRRVWASQACVRIRITWGCSEVCFLVFVCLFCLLVAVSGGRAGSKASEDGGRRHPSNFGKVCAQAEISVLYFLSACNKKISFVDGALVTCRTHTGAYTTWVRRFDRTPLCWPSWIFFFFLLSSPMPWSTFPRQGNNQCDTTQPTQTAAGFNEARLRARKDSGQSLPNN